MASTHSEYEQLADSMDEKLQELRQKLHLSDAAEKEQIEQDITDLAQKIGILRERLAEARGASRNEWDRFVDGISNAAKDAEAAAFAACG